MQDVDICTDDHPIIDFDAVMAAGARVARPERGALGMRALMRKMGGLRDIPDLKPSPAFLARHRAGWFAPLS